MSIVAVVAKVLGIGLVLVAIVCVIGYITLGASSVDFRRK